MKQYFSLMFCLIGKLLFGTMLLLGVCCSLFFVKNPDWNTLLTLVVAVSITVVLLSSYPKHRTIHVIAKRVTGWIVGSICFFEVAGFFFHINFLFYGIDNPHTPLVAGLFDAFLLASMFMLCNPALSRSH